MFPIRGTFRVISTIPSTVGGGGGEGKIPPWENCHAKRPPWETGPKGPATARKQDKARERTQAARRAVWEAAGVDTLPRFQCKRCGAGGFPTVGITGIHTMSFAKFCYIAASGRPDSKRLQISILQFNCYHWNIHSITSTKYRQLGWYCEDPTTHLSHLG